MILFFSLIYIWYLNNINILKNISNWDNFSIYKEFFTLDQHIYFKWRILVIFSSLPTLETLTIFLTIFKSLNTYFNFFFWLILSLLQSSHFTISPTSYLLIWRWKETSFMSRLKNNHFQLSLAFVLIEVDESVKITERKKKVKWVK